MTDFKQLENNIIQNILITSKILICEFIIFVIFS